MTQVAISADFLTALSQVPKAQQKKVRSFITQFRTDPTAASIHYEPIHDMRDPRIRTVRIDLAYRAVVLHPNKGDIFVLLWVDHHDEAMAWARNKLFEVNPVTGALQVLDTEAVTRAIETAKHGGEEHLPNQKELSEYSLFETFSETDLLRTGLPKVLLPAVRALRTPDDLDALQTFLPTEAFEALYWVANLGYSIDQALAAVTTEQPIAKVDTEDVATALTHPDSKRRFVLVDSDDMLAEMLNAPLEKWRIFLHPSQARLVERTFNGPARILGGAGTGKTVVAMHRARYLAKEIYNAKTNRVLFTTYTRNLATNIAQNLANLCGPELARIEVIHLHGWAAQFLRGQGVTVEIASDEEIDRCWKNALRIATDTGLTESFFRSEWRYVVQAQGLSEEAAYLRASRKGRGLSLSRPQRAAVWAVFEQFKRQLLDLGKVEWFDLIHQTRLYLASKGDILPYRAIIVDETQDWQPEDLRLLRQMIPEGSNDLFLVGDAHQRIYGRSVALSQCNIQVRGRSSRLRINYRTTEEIRNWSVALLTGKTIDDLDGGNDTHQEYLSLMHGDSPAIRRFATLDEEIEYLVSQIQSLTVDTPAENICVIARTHSQLRNQYIPALQRAGVDYLYLQPDTPEYTGSGVRLATMHRVKGLEFAHVFIIGVNVNVMPLIWRAEELDAIERGEIEMQERCLFHVASTRARESLSISCFDAPSKFLGKLINQ